MMKRAFCSMLFFLTIQLTVAQKSYDLYGKSNIDSVVVYQESTVNETSNGIISVEHLDQKIEGELIKFSLESATRTTFGKQTLKKTFLYDRSNFIANVMEQTLNSKDSSFLKGETVLFSIGEHNIWTVPQLESYTYHQQLDLEEELRILNDSVVKVKSHFDYPKKMRIGEQVELNIEKLSSFYEIKDIKQLRGTLTLNEVINRDNDTIAIFTISFKMRGIVEEDDNAYMTMDFEGTIERSLTHFYDRKVDVSGNLKMEGNIEEDQYLTMVVPVNLILKQVLE